MIARIGQLVGCRLDIFHDFDLVLQDNDRLEFPELDLVHRMLSVTLGSLYDLRGVSVRDYLGPPIEVSLGGIPYGSCICWSCARRWPPRMSRRGGRRRAGPTRRRRPRPRRSGPRT